MDHKFHLFHASTDHLTAAADVEEDDVSGESPPITGPLRVCAKCHASRTCSHVHRQYNRLHAQPVHQLMAKTLQSDDLRSAHSDPSHTHHRHTRSSKSWLNLSHKFSQLSLSATWAGHALLTSKFSQVFVFEGEGQDILGLEPSDVAAQLTLIDLPVFKAITESEFLSLAWNTPRKVTVAPNIVKLTRRFNQISFWVIEEILMSSSNRKCSNGSSSNNHIHGSSPHTGTNSNGSSPKRKWSPSSTTDWEAKVRAEVICFFIKVSRKLLDLNNLHSCYAIVSALTSAPIYRLSRTWTHVSRKERSAFDRLTGLFNDDSNFENLRNHLSQTMAPAIPYLGVFLRDLVFVDIAHPASAGHVDALSLRNVKMGRILHSVMKYQRSSYSKSR